MINTFEEFKKGIGRVGFNAAESKDEVSDLKKTVEIKNLERLKLLKENEELLKKSQEKYLNEMILKVSEELRMQIRLNEEFENKIEKIIGNRSQQALTERHQDVVVNGKSKSPTKVDKSPLKPPRSRVDKKELEISNSLASAIQQAQKTLESSKKEKRSISPGLSSSSLRYSTPPNQRLLNQSLISNR